MAAYIHWNLDPEITTLFGVIPLRYYSILFVTGLALGYWIVKQVYQKEGTPVEKLDQLTLYIFIGTILGARLGHCLFYEPDYYLSHPLEIILPFKGLFGDNIEYTGYQGLASHGGALGVLIAILLYCRKYGVRFLWVLDRITIAAAITGTFIRLGNFMNSEIIGKPTKVMFGVVFYRVDLVPRHPAQLYEAIAYLSIAIYLWKSQKMSRTQKQEGFLFGSFLLLIFSARFLIEFLKINQVEFENGIILNMGQLLSIPFILVGLGLRLRKRKPEAG